MVRSLFKLNVAGVEKEPAPIIITLSVYSGNPDFVRLTYRDGGEPPARKIAESAAG